MKRSMGKILSRALFLLPIFLLVQCSKIKSRDSHYTVSLELQKHSIHGVLPPTVADFNCIFINVMGEGIGDWETHKSSVSTSPNAYFGTFSGLAAPTSGASLSVSVAAGSGRIVQVLGAVSSVGCPSSPSKSDLNSTSSFPEIYQIARTNVDLFQDKRIELTSVYNPNTAVDVRYNLVTPTIPGTFSITTATASSGQVALVWGAASGAASYQVKRGTSSGNYSATLTTTTNTSYTDTTPTNGTTYYYVVVASNATGTRTTAEVSRTPAGVPTLAYTGAATGTFGVAFTKSPSTLSGNGANVTACAIKTGTTALPDGLSVAATTCVISGTPTETAATATYTLVATNSVGNSADATVSITINPDVPELSYDGAAGTSGTVGVAMTVNPTTLNTNGEDLSACEIKTGTTALPDGLAVDDETCVISGTPTETADAVTYTVVATNSAGDSEDATVELTIEGCTVGMFGGGDGSALTPYLIGNRTHLENTVLCTDSSVNFKQTGLIALGGAGTPWTPINLYGQYDGDGNQITGLYIRNTTLGSATGLFATVAADASVDSLDLDTVDIEGAGMTGALAGINNGDISNATVSGAVGLNYSSGSSASYFVGGLVGSHTAGSIDSSSSSATISVPSTSSSGASGAGGLVGQVTGATISDCSATGNVSEGVGSAEMRMGGLVGLAEGATISRCFSTGNVSADFNGSTYIGMVGLSSSSTVSQCFSKGTYSSPGFIRYSYIGGIVGYLDDGSIEDSYSMITHDMAGGEPTNGGASGGLVGYMGGTVTTSYSAASAMDAVASGTAYGFSGNQVVAGITSCYYYNNGSVPVDSSTGVTNLDTQLAMETQGSYTGFDFGSDWAMPDANALSPDGILSPVLQWQCGSNGINCPARNRTLATQALPELEMLY